MAQAPDYIRSKDFTHDAGDNTDHAALNTELDNASASINALNTNLSLIQGDDGKLLPDAVTLDSVSDEVIDFIADSIEQEIGDDIQRAEDAVLSAEASATEATTSASASAASSSVAESYASAASSSAGLAEASATQAALHEQGATHASEDAREWAEASATSANTAATSANTAAGSATSAAGSANAALTAAQSSGAHVMAAIASKDAAAESAAKAAAAAAEAAASAGQAGEGAIAAMPGAMSATAGGTPDVITACFRGGVSEPPKDHVVMYVRAIGANETTTPTFKPGGATPLVIVKGNNLPLAVGDIAGAGFEMLLQYNAEYDRFVLLNPAWGVFGSGGIPVGTIVTYGGTVVPAGFLSINSDSPICVGVATYPQLAESVWCGEELNESADFFYRCDGMDGADRNPDGAYLVLPAASKYFLRGRDASGEVHPYRYQEDATKVLLDGFSTGSNRAGNDRDVAIRAYTGTATYGIVTGTTTLSDRVGLNNAMHSVYGAADETRPMSFQVMVLIKAFDATLNPGMVDVTALANDVNQKVGLTDFGGSNQRLEENGYQIMPGGMLMQWGIIPANTSSVIFKKPFSQIFGVTFGWCNANAVGNAYSQWLGHQSISSEKMIVLSSGSVRFFTAIGMS